MNPIYLDLHIHTSDDPENLNKKYDLGTLISKIEETAQGKDFLISLTDHNTIHEEVYLDAVNKLGGKIILGVELHIKAYEGDDTSSYHCHIYFNLEEINSVVIQDLNAKLDELYPNKSPAKIDTSIPTIQRILNTFDSYSFILLPHGGQSHATFDTAMPPGRNFDTLMERSIYYNFLDGFTSRSNIGTEKTIDYLKRLGVNEFVNLVTCTDNYDPNIYPNPKAKDASEFIPTWMYAEANFSGLRLSLTDSSRFEYSKEKPRAWRSAIKSIKLNNKNLDINVELTPGLNVIIGESSSGKTMLIDSIERKLNGDGFEDSKYNHQYGVQDLEVVFPDAIVPHFIGQNFISEIISEEKNINEIPIIEQIFPKNTEARRAINKGLQDLRTDLESLFDSVESIENIESKIKTIPVLSKLISSNQVAENILKSLVTTINNIGEISYTEADLFEDISNMDRIEAKLVSNLFIQHDKSLIKKLKDELLQMRQFSILEEKVREVIIKSKLSIDKALIEKHGEEQNKSQKFEKLLDLLTNYYFQLNKFNTTLKKITGYSIKAESKQIEIQGNILSVENEFALTKSLFIKELNNFLLDEFEIANIDQLHPSDLFRSKFKNNESGAQRGSSPTYKYIKENINSKFIKRNKVNYKITTADGRDFDKLSPGLKTATILELVINFESDDAPLIIDQPEDNLATSYINGALVKSIKNNKRNKQIIFVSHNATIPMAGDAQNIILCENNGGKITIRSGPLEGKIGGKNVVDYVAKITDGGKPSVKKRFKKYDLKQFKD